MTGLRYTSWAIGTDPDDRYDVPTRASGVDLPTGVTRPTHHTNGEPLVDGDLWVDISDPNKPLVGMFYAPNSYDLSYDLSFQG